MSAIWYVLAALPCISGLRLIAVGFLDYRLQLRAGQASAARGLMTVLVQRGLGLFFVGVQLILLGVYHGEQHVPWWPLIAGGLLMAASYLDQFLYEKGRRETSRTRSAPDP